MFINVQLLWCSLSLKQQQHKLDQMVENELEIDVFWRILRLTAKLSWKNLFVSMKYHVLFFYRLANYNQTNTTVEMLYR